MLYVFPHITVSISCRDPESKLSKLQSIETFSFPRSTCNVKYFVHYVIVICAFQGHRHVVRDVSTLKQAFSSESFYFKPKGLYLVHMTLIYALDIIFVENNCKYIP